MQISLIQDPRADRLRQNEASKLASLQSILCADTEDVATDNYPVGTYIVTQGTLCRVTVPIARGEEIKVGQNVAATSVTAELLAIQENGE